MQIGLFFGSFNPIHIGHLIIANYIVEYSNLDQVWFVVTPHSPFKKKSTLLDNYQRLEMVYRATKDHPKLKPSDIEFNLPQPNYTINTLTYLQEKHPEHTFSLIMGQDNLKSFHKWKNYELILKNHHIYVYPRITQDNTTPPLIEHNNILPIDAPIIELSSSFIRQAIKAGKNVKPMLPENVWNYLDETSFYK
ncbi:nicotinate (nicotinamide) nucleotide adenylyltransferase [Snuella sedimenti]|uniref:Probable nicotinate-nucleotide adenylyltransferase n=1 Tax=Snuella sedimenti TaxID=2798802 RepID=A0A8J7J319_9FLAO|nr:nicotinate (nicotinamide) nucleotide adenylyltransferase [Snuella sedimenti]MBJ6367403.1 nicotinate-nucleotide adenylyltransferase [Snuella sedimenti]